MFEKASRLQLRFETARGQIMVEDLWNIPLDGEFSLNAVAKSLNRQLKASEEEDFVHPTATVDARIQLAFDIVKHIIAVRVAEAEESERKVALRQKKDRILRILAEKEDSALQEKSADELRKLLDTLN